MVAHADLTGANLHEPKGADSASVDTVYIADGLGSGTWQKVEADQIDQTSVLNVNKFSLTVYFPDIGTSGSIYVPLGVDCKLTKVTSVINGAIATTNTVLTVANYAGTTIGTITIAFSGSAAGDIDTLNAASNNTFLANTFLKITSDGATSSTVSANLTLDFEYE